MRPNDSDFMDILAECRVAYNQDKDVNRIMSLARARGLDSFDAHRLLCHLKIKDGKLLLYQSGLWREEFVKLAQVQENLIQLVEESGLGKVVSHCQTVFYPDRAYCREMMKTAFTAFGLSSFVATIFIVSDMMSGKFNVSFVFFVGLALFLSWSGSLYLFFWTRSWSESQIQFLDDQIIISRSSAGKAPSVMKIPYDQITGMRWGTQRTRIYSRKGNVSVGRVHQMDEFEMRLRHLCPKPRPQENY